MKSSTRNAAKTIRELSYYRQRYRNRFHQKLVSWITEKSQRDHVTKKDVAERLGKDPALITRLLSEPSNLTLDSVSDLLLAYDAEAEPPEIVEFKDRRPTNYVHPLISKVLNNRPGVHPGVGATASERKVELPAFDPRDGLRIEVKPARATAKAA